MDSGMKRIVLSMMLIFCVAAPAVEASAQNNPMAGSAPPKVNGATITMQNWRQYRAYMPDGMAMLFEGKYFWKMPPDVEMPIGTTELHPLPKNYLDTTEKYANQVKLVELAGGRLTLSGYVGGIPFPSPAEPHKGWKILANLWFRYLPHLTVDTNGVVCTVDSGESVSCKAGIKVYRQLSFNTDPGVPRDISGADGKYFTQWESVKEPEQDRYTTFITISYTDLTKPEDVYVFIPALRRTQRMSSAARCSADIGTDETPDDRRFGFNVDLTEVRADLISDKPTLMLMDYAMPTGRFPENYDMPLGWPKPSWGKWQVRNTDVVVVTKLPGAAQGCVGRRVVYIDKATSIPVWEDLYDQGLQPWRFIGFFPRTLDAPGIGPINASNSTVYGFWDVKYHHATVFAEPGEGAPFYINGQAPPEYRDLSRYTTPGGLSMIMR